MKLTTKQMMKIFDVDNMTIFNWRFPSKFAQKTKLPFHTEKVGKTRHRVFFVWSGVKKWAKKNNVLVEVHPKDLG